jgi:hypothetical protein
MSLIKTQTGSWIDPSMVMTVDPFCVHNIDENKPRPSYDWMLLPHHVIVIYRTGFQMSVGAFETFKEAQLYTDELSNMINSMTRTMEWPFSK